MTHASPGDTIKEAIFAFLQSHNIAYNLHHHKPLFTCEEAKVLRPNVQGGTCKNLFARNKKGDAHYLIVATPQSRVDLKALRKEVGASAMSFASERRLWDVLRTKPGSVSPLGLIFDQDHKTQVIIEDTLMEYSHLNFHPNCNTETVEIPIAGFRTYLEAIGHPVRYLSFPKES